MNSGSKLLLLHLRLAIYHDQMCTLIYATHNDQRDPEGRAEYYHEYKRLPAGRVTITQYFLGLFNADASYTENLRASRISYSI